MKHSFRLILLAILFPLAFVSCVDDEEYNDSPTGNFEALWHLIDEHYCYFSYKKQQYGLDWNQVYESYKPRASAAITPGQLFEILGDMLGELRDGHVNMYSSADVSRYWSWKEDFPANYSD